MATFLFWNINKKPLIKEIVDLCEIYEVDVLILAESKIPDTTLLIHLNSDSNSTYLSLYNQLSTRLQFFFKYPPKSIQPVADDAYISIRKLNPPIGQDILIAGLHLPSKLRANDEDQKFDAIRIAGIIREAEKREGHERTVVIGDFNMNPFEVGVVIADSFHAVMDQNIAQKRSRTVSGKKQPFFYNPMWGRMGDLSAGPPGTYYYDKSKYVNYFWNTFDQVLLRPDLLDYFEPQDLRVISEINGKSLIKNNRTSKDYSDHLPLLIKLHIERMNNDTRTKKSLG